MAPHQQPVASTKSSIPYCGMTVDPARAAGHVDYQGQTYYFCGRGCTEKFRADPGRFVEHRAERTVPTSAAHVGVTCPMHPQIRRSGRGQCPICGMALEPVTATLDEHPNEELVDMSRRFSFQRRPYISAAPA